MAAALHREHRRSSITLAAAPPHRSVGDANAPTPARHNLHGRCSWLSIWGIKLPLSWSAGVRGETGRGVARVGEN
jgi:hypothetical protein